MTLDERPTHAIDAVVGRLHADIEARLRALADELLEAAKQDRDAAALEARRAAESAAADALSAALIAARAEAGERLAVELARARDEADAAIRRATEEAQAEIALAREDAEAEVTYARERAQVQVAEARQEAQQEVARAREAEAISVRAREAAEAAAARARDEAEAAINRARDEAQAAVARAREEADDIVARGRDEAEAAISRVRHEAQADVARAREEAEAIVAGGREEAEATVRRIRDETRADAIRAREEAQAEVALAHEETRAHAAAADAARAQADAAQAQAAAARAQADAARAQAAAVPPGAAPDDGRGAGTDHLLGAIRRLDQGRSLTDVLTILTDVAAGQATRVVLGFAQGEQVHVWRMAGFGPAAEPFLNTNLDRDQAGALAVAIEKGASCRVPRRREHEGREGREEHEGREGLRGHEGREGQEERDQAGRRPGDEAEGRSPVFATLPAGGAGLAVPIMIGGRAVGAIYADVLAGSGRGHLADRLEGLEILARHAARCLETLTALRTLQVAGAGSGATEAMTRRADGEQGARQYARLLVSEIKLYHEPAVRLGRQHRDLLQRLQPEIERARRLFEDRVPPAIGARESYFEEELVRTLADGDPSLLGGQQAF